VVPRYYFPERLSNAMNLASEGDAERKIVVLTTAPDTEDETRFRLALLSGTLG
jgi:hypothetical protein